jgi:hypothetical protein
VVAALGSRLDLEQLVNATVRMAGRNGGTLPGREVLRFVHTIVAGGTHTDHADVLRAGGIGRVLGHRVMAPSTLGTFLRSFTSAMSASSRPWFYISKDWGTFTSDRESPSGSTTCLRIETCP